MYSIDVGVTRCITGSGGPVSPSTLEQQVVECESKSGLSGMVKLESVRPTILMAISMALGALVGGWAGGFRAWMGGCPGLCAARHGGSFDVGGL